jgi:hypothetical protein
MPLIYNLTLQNTNCTKGESFFKKIHFFIADITNSFCFRFCFNNEHVVTSSASGIDAYAACPSDDLLWPEGSVSLPIPDDFRKIWKCRCPTICIHNDCEDACPECNILKDNKFDFMGNDYNNE